MIVGLHSSITVLDLFSACNIEIEIILVHFHKFSIEEKAELRHLTHLQVLETIF